MKHKIEFAPFVINLILFFLLSSSKLPFLFTMAFVLLVAKGIQMTLKANAETSDVNEAQPKENLPKLILIRLVLLIFPLVFTASVFYIFFLRIDILLKVFNHGS